MKRTPLKRSSKPLKRTPLKRVTPLRQRKPGKKAEPGSSVYLRWIRTLPCLVCGGAQGPSEAAHTKTHGSAGAGYKSSYLSCIPLCTHDHVLAGDSYHRVSPESCWAAHHGLDLDLIVRALNAGWELRRRRAA